MQEIWPPHVKSWLIGKESDAGRDWGQEEKGTTEDEMAGWHHWLDGLGSGWTPGVGDGQGGLACCDSWGRKELDTTERLNWTELNAREIVRNSEWTIGTLKAIEKDLDCGLTIYYCVIRDLGFSVYKISILKIISQNLWFDIICIHKTWHLQVIP